MLLQRCVSVRHTAALVCACLLFSLALRAQVTTADIVGNVTDSSGAVVSGAKVTVENLATHDSRAAQTGGEGAYVFTLLPIGSYSVRVEFRGFKTFTVPSVTLASADHIRVDARMEIGQMAETVEVTAQPPALQTDSSAVGALVTSQSVQDLPVNGRNFMALAQVQAGANAGSPTAITSGTRPDDRRANATISVNATDSYMNNYLIDGMDDNERYLGTMIVRPSMDALAEFRVETNLFTAEVGRSAGAVVNIITKSGTNDIHGTLFEFFRNDKMDAQNFFAVGQPKSEYRLNQFGGSAGGPIVKNKLFYFGDIEETRQIKGSTYVNSVPTPAMIAGNYNGVATIYDPATTVCATATSCTRTPFSGNQIPANRISPIGAEYLSLYPAPQRPGLTNNFVYSPSSTQYNTTFDTRADYHLNDNNYFFGRYSYNDTTTFIPGSLPTVGGIQLGGIAAFPGLVKERAQQVSLSYVHIWRSNLLGEFKAGWTRFADNAQQLNYGKNISTQFGIPGTAYALNTSGLAAASPASYTPLGDNPGAFLPIQDFDNTYQYLGSLTWTKGKHTIKFGAGVTRRQFTNFQSNSSIGLFGFDANATNNGNFGAGTGNGIASLLLGTATTAARSVGLIWPGYRVWEPSGYVQDDWRISQRLTINIGGRYDIFTPYTEVANRMANFNTQTGQLMVAGQNGVSSTAGVHTDYSNFAPRFGFAANLGSGFVLRGGYGISYTPETTGSAAVMKNAPFISDFSYNGGQFPNYNLSQGFPFPIANTLASPGGTIRAVNPDFKATSVQQFNLTVQKDIAHGNVVGLGYVGALSRHEFNAVPFDNPLPGPGTVQSRRPYYGLYPATTAINQANTYGTGDYHSLQATFVHRFANGLNMSSNYTWAHSIDDTLGTGIQTLPNYRGFDRGSSTLDIRHRFVITANYQLPFGKSYTGFRKQLIQGWQLNGIYVWSTGLPFTVTNLLAVSNTGSGDRPNVVGNAVLSNPTINEWFNVNAFRTQPSFTMGNAGRDILYAPSQSNLDLSVFKNFAIRERWNLEFRGESFNITNTPFFGAPTTTLGSPNFGAISTTLGNPRQVQLALKLLF